MKRVHLPELEDYDWYPANIRNKLTQILRIAHQTIDTPSHFGPYVQKLLDHSTSKQIVDLCSGGGGPIVDIFAKLPTAKKLYLTDLYPNESAKQELDSENIVYYPDPVNAADVPKELQGVRTMFSSFHHMRPEIAKSILKNAWENKTPIGIFELTSRDFLSFLSATILFPPAGVIRLLFEKPELENFLFTTLLPVVPATLAWDGFASCWRTYSVEELNEMTSDLQSADYTWEIFETSLSPLPYDVPVLLGYPS
ncbi:MAG: hypothetical protein D6767_07365 [Candidatus Hydrogenedentota bacterium]|nr:MAG: hypothetical protein D6767_07365 [Candidatus Hydrogenedentota bacterium]